MRTRDRGSNALLRPTKTAAVFFSWSLDRSRTRTSVVLQPLRKPACVSQRRVSERSVSSRGANTPAFLSGVSPDLRAPWLSPCLADGASFLPSPRRSSNFRSNGVCRSRDRQAPAVGRRGAVTPSSRRPRPRAHRATPSRHRASPRCFPGPGRSQRDVVSISHDADLPRAGPALARRGHPPACSIASEV